MGSAEPAPVVPRSARALQGLTLVLLAAYVVWTLPGVRSSPGFNTPFDGGLQCGLYVLVALLCVVGARLHTRLSMAWWLVVVAVCLRTLGFVVVLSMLSAGHALPYPSLADTAWVLSAVALIAAVALRLRELAPRLPLLVVLDGVAAALIVLALSTAVLAGPVDTLTAPGVPRSAIVVNVGYPVLDTALLVAASTLVTAVRAHLGRADLRLVAGSVAFALIDVVFLVLLAEGKWRPGTLLASFSVAAAGLIASAVWAAPARRDEGSDRRVGELPAATPAPGVALPVTLAGVSLVGLAVSGAVGVPTISLLAFGVAGAVSSVRGSLTLRSDRREADAVLGVASEDLRRFHALVEASTDFIGMADADGNVLYINPAGRRMLGLASGADVTSLTVAELVGGEGASAIAVRWPALLEQGSWRGTSEVFPVDGGPPIPVAVSTFVIDDPQTREPFAVATIQRDIRERLETESALQDLADQRAQLLTRLVQAQEDERTRIAADVHDDSVQALAAVQLRLSLLRHRLAEDAPDLVETADALTDTVAAATGRLRHLLFDLESPARMTGLADALAEAAAFVFEGTEMRWRVTGERDLALPEAERVTAYRVAKEAMVNVRKHADARLVVVDLGRHEDGVVVSVRDDGRGIRPGDESPRPGHLGLSSMRDRVQVAGGRLDVHRLPEGGTEVRLTLPTSAASASSR